MTDFFDKLKALSNNHSIASESEETDSDSSFRPTQVDGMVFDPNSQPSIPQDSQDASPSKSESGLGDASNHAPNQDAAASSRPDPHSSKHSDATEISAISQSATLPKRDRRLPNGTSWIRQRLGSKPIYQRWSLWILLGLGAIAGGTYATVQDSIEAARQDLPDPSAVFTFVRGGTLTIKSSDGTILQQMGPATRDSIAYDDIPPRLIDAFIAAEDKNFYEHTGVDYQAIVRALRSNIAAREVVEGGSTITQQLARIVFLDQAPTLDRKIREAMMARKLEQDLTKEQILERYLNLVYLGSGAYGVADAAWIYFSKTVDELTTSEMATIAGLAPAPSVYSPLVNLDAAESRRNNTLERMVETKAITEAEKERLMSEPLAVNPSLPKNFYSAVPYFTSYIEDQLPNYVSSEQLEAGGLTVETTLNLEWQRLAEETVKAAVDDYGAGQRFSQAAMVTIEPRTGAIKTMVGGTDFGESQFNRVTQAQRQPGSTFKTFVYAAAIAAGFSPYRDYVDAKFIVDGYEPQNYGRNYRGSVSIREALISSINVVAVKTLIDVGFTPVIDLARSMGIKSELLPTYSLALGASEVNLLELTNAYGTLANQGNYVEAHGIVRILDRYDEVIYEVKSEPQRALDENSSAIVTWMLQSVVQGGTGSRARLGRPVAGKTGTSEERRDLWFIGYVPQMVTGVWLGNDDNQPTWGASSTAAQVWGNFMEVIVEGIPVEEFPDLPNLNNRDGTIEAQPVEPGSITASQDSGDEERSPSADTESSSENNSASTSQPSEAGDDANNRSRSAGTSGAADGAESAASREDDAESSDGNASANDSSPSAGPDTPAPAPAPAPPPPPPPPMPEVQPSTPAPSSPSPPPADTGDAESGE